MLDKDNPSQIQRHLQNLVYLGLIEKEKVYDRNKFLYFINSSILDLFFYIDDKCGLLESDISIEHVKKVVDEKLPLYIKRFFRNLLITKYGLRSEKIVFPEIDVALFRFKKLEVIAEVKWQNKFSQKDLSGLEKKLSNYKNVRKILIVKNKRG